MSFRFVRYAAAAAAVALAACSGGPSATSLPSSSAVTPSITVVNGEHVIRVGSQVYRFGGHPVRRAARRSWLSPAAGSNPLLFGSSYNGGFIQVYSQKGTNQSPIGQLSNGLLSPQGMAVDQNRRLWVANTNAFTVVGFRHGATSPFITLKDPNYYPLQVAVDGNGTVYASNAESTTGPPGNVTFWHKGSKKPSGTLTYPDFLIVLGVGVDASNNVYVSYIPTSGPPAMVEFPAGSQTGQPMNIQGTGEGEMTFDSSGNFVMETAQNTLGVWAPPYNGGPARTLPAFGNEPTLNKSEHKVWIAYANYSTPYIQGYNYTTGALIDTISKGWSPANIPIGVALDPPAPR